MWAHGITASLSLYGPQTRWSPRSAERFWRSAGGCWTAAVGSDSLFTNARRLKTCISSERVCARLPSACEVANRHLPRNYACASIAFLTGTISWSVDSILRRTRKIEKSDYELLHVCTFVRSSVWNSTPTGRIFTKFDIYFLKMSRKVRFH